MKTRDLILLLIGLLFCENIFPRWRSFANRALLRKALRRQEYLK